MSNLTKRKETTIEKLGKLGFKKNDFFEVMTSGEIIWQNLYTKSHKLIKTLGSNCYYLFDKTKEDGLKYNSCLSNYDYYLVVLVTLEQVRVFGF